MKIVRSTLSLLLVSSFACAQDPVIGKRSSIENRLEQAIHEADVQSVRDILDQGGFDINKGLGSNRQPALVLAIEKLAGELREHAQDYTWYIISSFFGAAAVFGLYELLRERSDAQMGTVGIPKRTLEKALGIAQKDSSNNIQEGSEVASVVAVSGSDESSSKDLQPDKSDDESPALEDQSQQQEVIVAAVEMKEQRNPLRKLKNLVTAGIGTAAARFSWNKAKKDQTKTSVRTPSVERRLEIVRLLARYKDTNIFAADAQGSNAVDLVITYMAGYDPSSECYACMEEVMEEVKDSIAVRMLRSIECSCTDCSCDNCQCEIGQACLCSDCSSEKYSCVAKEECACVTCECTPEQNCTQ